MPLRVYGPPMTTSAGVRVRKRIHIRRRRPARRPAPKGAFAKKVLAIVARKEETKMIAENILQPAVLCLLPRPPR